MNTSISAIIHENLEHNGFKFANSKGDGRHVTFSNHEKRLAAALHWKEDFSEATIEFIHYPHDNIPVDGHRVAFEYIRSVGDLAGALGKVYERAPLTMTFQGSDNLAEGMPGLFKSEFLRFELDNNGDVRANFIGPEKHYITIGMFSSQYAGVPFSAVSEEAKRKINQISIEGTRIENGWMDTDTANVTSFIYANLIFPPTDDFKTAMQSKEDAEGVLKELRLILQAGANPEGSEDTKKAVTAHTLSRFLNMDHINDSPERKNIGQARPAITSVMELGGFIQDNLKDTKANEAGKNFNQ